MSWTGLDSKWRMWNTQEEKSNTHRCCFCCYICIIPCIHAYITLHPELIMHSIICTGDSSQFVVFCFEYKIEESSLSQFRTTNQMIKKQPSFSTNCECIIIVCVGAGGENHILLTEASRKSFSVNKYKYIWVILQPGELFLLLFYTASACRYGRTSCNIVY